MDKAAYIAAQKVPSKRDADYLKFAREATGMSDEEVRAHGADVRAAIKKQAKDARPGPLEIGKVERKGESPAAETTPVVDDAKRAAAAERAKDWYSRSKVAVESFIENNGLGDTHEVTATNRGFEAKPKADLGTRQEHVAEQPVTKA